MRAGQIFLLLLCSAGFIDIACGQGSLTVKEFTVLEEPAENMMKEYLTALVDEQFEARDSLLSTLRTSDDWDKRARTVQDSILSWTGPLPERTPLNARITGRFKRDGYAVEKILFESRPGFIVSANLYLPENISNPIPVVLNVIGHSPTGKARDKVQQRSIAQAQKGFVALTIDCLGQGERTVPDYHYLGTSPGYTHGIVGLKAFLCGTHVFNFMVWDAIRAVDYLVSRPEVDKERICITGCSGGGMMSTYILPFEKRIAVAVPACNPNTWSHRVHAGLATDHEQVFFGAFASGIDPRGDPLFVQVPKPLMINATSRDNLNPSGGVWELSTWLYKAYAAHGVPERFTTTMIDAPHGYNLEQRELAYSWMLNWTDGDAADFREGDLPLEKDEDLWASQSGNVHYEPGSRKPLDWILDYLNENKAEWEPVRSAAELEQHRNQMKEMIKEVLHANTDDLNVKASLGKSRKVDELSLQSFQLEPEEGIIIPGILIGREQFTGGQDVILFVSDKGKSDILTDKEIINELTSNGLYICAVDLRGYGETSPDMAGKFWDFLAGKPIFGQRVFDILAVTEWLQGPEVHAKNVMYWGKGMGGLYGAFAGILTDGLSGFVMEESLLSFESVVRVNVPEYGNEVLLPGILQKFDMPEVYQALSPRKVALLNPLSGDKTPAGKSEISALEKAVSGAFKAEKRKKAWRVQGMKEDDRDSVIAKLFTDNQFI